MYRWVHTWIDELYIYISVWVTCTRIDEYIDRLMEKDIHTCTCTWMNLMDLWMCDLMDDRRINGLMTGCMDG